MVKRKIHGILVNLENDEEASWKGRGQIDLWQATREGILGVILPRWALKGWRRGGGDDPCHESGHASLEDAVLASKSGKCTKTRYFIGGS